MGKADRLKKKKEEEEEQTSNMNQILSSQPIRPICHGQLALVVFQLLQSAQNSMPSLVGSPFKSWVVFCYKKFHRRLVSLPQGISLADVKRSAVDLCHKLTSEQRDLLFSGFRFSSVFSAFSEDDKHSVILLMDSCKSTCHENDCPLFSAPIHILFGEFLHCSPRRREMCGPKSDIGYHVKCNHRSLKEKANNASKSTPQALVIPAIHKSSNKKLSKTGMVDNAIRQIELPQDPTKEDSPDASTAPPVQELSVLHV